MAAHVQGLDPFQAEELAHKEEKAAPWLDAPVPGAPANQALRRENKVALSAGVGTAAAEANGADGEETKHQRRTRRTRMKSRRGVLSKSVCGTCNLRGERRLQ